MPVARGPQINPRSAVLVGATGVVVALLLGAMVLYVAGRGNGIQLNLGDTRFDAGFTDRIAAAIEEDGPILYADAGSRGQRDIYLQHIGDDPGEGWLAFSARRAGDPRSCTAQWDGASGSFTLTATGDAPCDDVHFDARGCGLVRYPVAVLDDKVTVFLNETQEEVAAAVGDATLDPADPLLTCTDG